MPGLHAIDASRSSRWNLDAALASLPLPAKSGDALHVAAGVEHRFHAISGNFAAWVVFFAGESE